MQTSVSDIPVSTEIELTGSQYAVIETAESLSASSRSVNIEIIRHLENSFLAADAAGRSFEVRRNCKNALDCAENDGPAPKQAWGISQTIITITILGAIIVCVLAPNLVIGAIFLILQRLAGVDANLFC